MSRRQINIYVLVGLLVGVLVLIFAFGTRSPYNWVENYFVTSKGPYGTYVVKELLDDFYKGEPFTIMEDSLDAIAGYEKNDPANYIFIGASQYLDSTDIETLVAFVEKGNNAFIASRSLDDQLLEFFYYYDCDDIEWGGYQEVIDTNVSMNLQHGNLALDSAVAFRFIYRSRPANYKWQFISSDFICDVPEGFVELGYFNEYYPNFVRIAIGEGFFYLHTNPIVFSNIELLDKKRLPYISAVFSNLSNGPIFWDEYSKLPGYIDNRPSRRGLSDKSPFQYILSQPPLAWAWYLVVVMTLLYLLFRTKRRQRIIPVLERNSNTSLEFLQTIGHLYFLQNDHKKIALHKMRLFLGFLRDHYSLQTNDLDATFVQGLSAKSEISKDNIDAILLLYKNIKSSSLVSQKILKDFHELIEDFYKNCK